MLRLGHVVPETSRLALGFDKFAEAFPPILRIGVGALFDECRDCRIGFANLAFLYLEFLLFLDKGTIAYLRRR